MVPIDCDVSATAWATVRMRILHFKFLTVGARRWRRLVETAGNILCGRRDGRPHGHVAWLSLIGLVYLLLQANQLGGFLLPTAGLFSALCIIAVFDARYFIIPDGPILFLLGLGVATFCISDWAEAPSRLAAAGVGYFALVIVAWAYQKWRGAPGLGLGDAKLFAVAGLWLGPTGLPSCLLLAVLSALASVAISLRDGSLPSLRQPVPFGPHLALGLWLVWAFGPLEAS
jgi:leader peptidase (prepilin peptidase)/N-methyltransferase